MRRSRPRTWASAFPYSPSSAIARQCSNAIAHRAGAYAYLHTADVRFGRNGHPDDPKRTTGVRFTRKGHPWCVILTAYVRFGRNGHSSITGRTERVRFTRIGHPNRLRLHQRVRFGRNGHPDAFVQASALIRHAICERAVHTCASGDPYSRDPRLYYRWNTDVDYTPVSLRRQPSMAMRCFVSTCCCACGFGSSRHSVPSL